MHLPQGLGIPSMLLALFLLCAAGRSQSHPPDAGLRQEPILLPHGVMDVRGRTGYVSESDEHILALDLQNGRQLWRSIEASRPLIVSGNRLAALTTRIGPPNEAHVVVLDISQQGKVLLQSKPLVFPEWASTRNEGGLTFAYRCYLEGGNLVLDWHAGRHYFGGARPTPQIEAAARRSELGSAHIDLKTGAVQMLPFHGRPEDIQPFPLTTTYANRRYQYAKEAVGLQARTAPTYLVAEDLKSGRQLWRAPIGTEPTRQYPP